MTISVTDTALDMEKKAIERCGRRSLLRSWLVWIYCSAILVSFSIFFIFWCTNSFQNYVLSHLELRNGTRTFTFWQNPPVNMIYNIYIFNYTNVEDFERYLDDKLHVQEVGPYVYEQTMNRVNVEMHKNGTVTYQEKRSFQWIGGRHYNDTVIVPNVLLMTSIAYVRDLGFAAQLGLTAMLSTLQEQPFIKEEVDGYLWGYDSEFFRMVKPLMMFERDIPFDKFGLLAMENGINKDRITIDTGSRSLDNLGMIEQVNGANIRHIWGDERCDKIEGTDGSMFPPYLIKNTNETLYIYIKNICVKLPYRFSKETITYGIPALRYKLPVETFTYSSKQNECFCPKIHGTRVCPPAGIFNFSVCNHDLPLLISFPHFYSADKSLLEQIDGLNPQQEYHESYLDIHQRMALPMSGRTKFQLNVEVRRANGVPFLGRLKDGAILPVIWVDAKVDEIPASMLKDLRAAHFTANAVETTFQWCSLIAIIFSVTALIAYLRKYRIEQTL